MSKLSTNEIYEKLVAKFLENLDKGINPFAVTEPPKSFATGTGYTGFNRFVLAGVMKENGYTSGSFITASAAKKLGASVKENEKGKGHPLFYWGTLYIYAGDVVASGYNEDQAYKRAKRKNTKLKKTDLLKTTRFMDHWTVYNLAQIDGLESTSVATQSLTQFVDNFSKETGWWETSNVVNYDGSADKIYRPDLLNGDDELMMLPSMAEWTGHPSRLGREFTYPQEKLIDTMAASFLGGALGQKEVFYDEGLVDGWIAAIRENSKFLYKASTQAQKAVDYLLDAIKYREPSVAKAA